MHHIEPIPNTSGMCWAIASGAGRFVLTRYNSRNWHLHERGAHALKGPLHSIGGNLAQVLAGVRVFHAKRLPRHS